MQYISQWLDRIIFPQETACHLCETWTERGILCDRCAAALMACRRKCTLADPHPPLSACIAVWRYEAEARQLIHLLKYENDGYAARMLGEAMAHALCSHPDILHSLDVVMPVPLHVRRLEERGFNQALLLAKAVCDHLQLSLDEDALERTRFTGRQVGRTRDERFVAMHDAFAVKSTESVRGKQVLLVDDILTTGATACACASALLRCGAAKVYLLTACRT